MSEKPGAVGDGEWILAFSCGLAEDTPAEAIRFLMLL
jgi:hypothetical protein